MSDNPAMKMMNEIMQKYNFIETMKNTYGIAVLDNGMHVKVLNNFEGVCENWKLLKEAYMMDDEDAINEILSVNTRGGLIDTGTIVLDIQSISAMYPIYRELHDDNEVKQINENKVRHMNKFLFGEQDF